MVELFVKHSVAVMSRESSALPAQRKTHLRMAQSRGSRHNDANRRPGASGSAVALRSVAPPSQNKPRIIDSKAAGEQYFSVSVH